MNNLDLDDLIWTITCGKKIQVQNMLDRTVQVLRKYSDHSDDELLEFLKIECLKKNASFIKKIDKPTLEMYRTVVRSYSCIQFIDFSKINKALAEELYVKAVKYDGHALEFIKFHHNHTEDFIYSLYLTAIQCHPSSIQFINPDTIKLSLFKQLVFKALCGKARVIKHINTDIFDKDTREEIWKFAIAHNAYCINYVSAN